MVKQKAKEVEEEYEIPEKVEEVLEELLTGLRDKNTIVRLSEAKGIGRVTPPAEKADEERWTPVCTAAASPRRS